MGKAPAFQIYPMDYLRDTRHLSLAAKGAWTDLLFLMWGAQNRGTLTSSAVGYSRMIGGTVEQTVAALHELIESRVCDAYLEQEQGPIQIHNLQEVVTGRNGEVTDRNLKVTVISRRMAREEKERQNGALRAQRFRDIHQKEASNGEVTPPSSSSSSSSSSLEEEESNSYEELLSPARQKKVVSPVAQWPEDGLWLKAFIERQTIAPSKMLLDPAWWKDVATTCGGIEIDFLGVEFARMSAWLSENRPRTPASRSGWKKFIRHWLEDAHERERKTHNVQFQGQKKYPNGKR